MGERNTETVGSVETCFGLIEALQSRDGAGVTELADAVGVSKGAAYKQLNTLVELGYAENDGGSYRLTLQFLGVGRLIQVRRRLFRVGKPIVDDLAGSTGAIASIQIVEDGFGVYLYRSGDGVLDAPVQEGDRVHLHATAGGKAMVAHMDRLDAEAILDRHGLPALTDKTATDRGDLFAELRSIRDRGLAFDRGEHEESWQGAATPILLDGEPIGAVSVSGPRQRLHGKTLTEDVPGLLVSVTKDLQVAIRNE